MSVDSSSKMLSAFFDFTLYNLIAKGGSTNTYEKLPPISIYLHHLSYEDFDIFIHEDF